jgi:hypothetical protein
MGSGCPWCSSTGGRREQAAQQVGQRAAVGRALGRLLGEAAGDQRHHTGREVRAQRVGPLGGLLHVRAHDVERAGAGRVRRLAGEDLEQHQAQRVHVGRRRDGRQARALLGRHVARRAHHEALREAGVVAVAPAGHAEVAQPRVEGRAVGARVGLGAEQDVGGLHVAVDDAALVGHGQSRRHVVHDPHGVALGHGALGLAVVIEARALHQLHDQEHHAAVLVDLDEVGDVRVPDLGQHARLATEAAELHVVEHGVGLEDLDGHGRVGAQLLGPEHLAVGAAAEAVGQAVAAEHGAGLGHHARALAAGAGGGVHQHGGQRAQALADGGALLQVRVAHRREHGARTGRLGLARQQRLHERRGGRHVALEAGRVFGARVVRHGSGGGAAEVEDHAAVVAGPDLARRQRPVHQPDPVRATHGAQQAQGQRGGALGR